MGKIVAIGGGELRNGETEAIDKYIVSLADKQNPKLLFIPTASNDASSYIEVAKEKFSELGCVVDTLCLVTNSYSDKDIEEKILGSEIIYVGGGDTVSMIEKWKEYNVDLYLKEAYKKGIVLSGLSAGSICWFIFGHSDSESFSKEGHWEYIRAYGLGLIPMAHCPHYNEEGREGFDEMMKDVNVPGIALENNTALVAIDGNYHIIKSDEKRDAYLIQSSLGSITKKQLAIQEFTL